MAKSPSILMLDDGELDRVQGLLERLNADFVRQQGDPDGVVELPRDLLITSGPRAMKMSHLESDADCVWICIYDQDFLPLRERLRELGVHFLVSGDLESQTFALFLRQLLHQGAERRAIRRIPLFSELELEIGRDRSVAQLVELSRHTCVFIAQSDLPVGDRAIVRLPEGMMGDERVDLSGFVLRSSAGVGRDDEPVFTVVLEFEDLEPNTHAKIHALLSGHALGTQVTPLADERLPLDTSVVATDQRSVFELASDEPAGWRVERDGERRAEPRHPYRSKVEAVCWHGEHGPPIALGHDLSLTGVRIFASAEAAVGAKVTLALYGGAREEPVVVDARVVRLHHQELSLKFEGLSPNQRRGLERLVHATPQVESLAGHGGSVHVAELIDGDGTARL